MAVVAQLLDRAADAVGVGQVDEDLLGPDHQRHRTLGRLGEHDLAEGARGPRLRRGAGQHDRSAHERGDLRVGRGEVDLARGRGLHQPARAHHRDLVGEGQRLVLVVGDQQRGGVGGGQGAAHGAGGALAQTGVEGGEGLVEEHHGGLGRQRTGQRDALLLAAGELVGPSGAELPRQLDQVEDLVDAVSAPLLGRQAEGDVGGDVEVGEERALLRDVPDAAVLRRDGAGGAAGHHGVAEGDGPRVGREEAGDEPQQRGLAAPGVTQHRGEGAVRHLEADVVDGAGAPRAPGPPGGEGLRDGRDGQGAHAVPLGVVGRSERISRTVAGIETSTSSRAYGAAAP